MPDTATTTTGPTPIFDTIAAEMGIDWDEETAASAVAPTAEPDGQPHDEHKAVQLAS